MTDTTYNGWKNYETWNVSLWVQNDESMYNLARSCGRRFMGWDILAEMLAAVNPETPDGVRWDDASLDRPRLNEMLSEM
jgi:hypothetical protein